MRRCKFALLTVCILLVGALTAGLAARAVVTPRAGETVSAGVLSVPSVLGQTAEEVLFYPWSQYDAQTLSPLPSDYWSHELWEETPVDTPLSNLLAAFQVLGASYDQSALLSHLVWNDGKYLFLKDFPTTLCEDETPVTLSFAFSESAVHSLSVSISYLIYPAQSVEPTQEQQNAALEKVRSDLLEYLRAFGTLQSEPLELLEAFGKEETMAELEEMYGQNTNELAFLLDSFFIYYWELTSVWGESVAVGEMEQLSHLRDLLQQAGLSYESGDLSQVSLEELLDVLEDHGCTVQLISTPQQIILLFTLNDGSVFGVYYDIQLERYSGFGMSF